MTDTTLLLHDADGVRTITLNRTEKRNALDSALGRALVDALRAADQDESVGAVLLAANGKVFCAGADLSEFKGERANPQAEAVRSELFLELQLVFEQIQVPVVCAVAGPAVGAGASLAIASDFTVMAESAKLSWPEIIHGMVPSLMIGHLQHRTNRKTAFELLAFGDSVSADQALALGLASRVVPDADLMTVATQAARTLASRPRAAMRETKDLFIRHASLPLPDALRAARAAARERQARAAAPR
ncbi:enoyl-CoA hydratase/isomerase family protein [Ramlibacter sp.]|uniref:enoyl-CoA hydratase/isomerase family protein n=1 Tax=Ramlibacter sp. TaxID=1917967 RepID=UPI003D0A33C1